jgi:hypothetical protein
MLEYVKLIPAGEMAMAGLEFIPVVPNGAAELAREHIASAYANRPATAMVLRDLIYKAEVGSPLDVEIDLNLLSEYDRSNFLVKCRHFGIALTSEQ